MSTTQDVRCGLIASQEDKEKLIETGKALCVLSFYTNSNVNYFGDLPCLFMELIKSYPVVEFYLHYDPAYSSSCAILLYNEKQQVVEIKDKNRQYGLTEALNGILMKACMNPGGTKANAPDLRNGIINTNEEKEKLIKAGKPLVLLVANVEGIESKSQLGLLLNRFIKLTMDYPIVPSYIDNVATTKKNCSIELYDETGKIAEMTSDSKPQAEESLKLQKAFNSVLLKAFAAQAGK